MFVKNFEIEKLLKVKPDFFDSDVLEAIIDYYDFIDDWGNKIYRIDTLISVLEEVEGNIREDMQNIVDYMNKNDITKLMIIS